MERAMLNIEGMSCGHCVRAVANVLGSIEGVRVDTVEVGSASVQFDGERVAVEQIAEVIRAAGYPASAVKEGA